ncbi:MAG: hypothetical protein PUC65_01695 [Clostridiales bacterium]|nr:hypothetical protein [Clostridiales bacterium]
MKKIASILLGILLIIMPFNQQKVLADEIGLKDLPPKLIIESYEITNGQLIPGEQFTLKLTIKNTNPYIEAQNIMLLYSSVNNVVYPVFGNSNQYFISSIQGGKKATVELPMTVFEKTKDSVASVNVQLQYSSENGKDTTSTSGLIFPISASCSMDITTLSVAQSSTIGSKSLVGIAYMNTGFSDIKNAKMLLDGDILEEQKEILLGDLAIGAQASKDCYVNFQHEGTQTLSVSFSYEDTNGVVYTIPATSFTTTVNPAVVNTFVEVSANPESKTLMESIDVWQMVAIIGGIIAVLVIIFAIVKVKNRRKF